MRKIFSHDLPPNLFNHSEKEVFFITVCCERRGVNQLATAEIWQAIIDTIEYREQAGDVECRLLLAMPDHLHGLFHFPQASRMKPTISALKAWLARSHGVRWQRDFFDHRLRGWESAEEKRKYILMNPVRAGLVGRPEDWPFMRDCRDQTP